MIYVRYRRIYCKYLPILTETCLLKWSASSQTSESVPLLSPIRLCHSVSLVLTIDSQVFITGASLKSDTYRVNPYTGEWNWLDSLRKHRYKMGVVRYQTDIYAFAGLYDGLYMRNAEVYGFAEEKWRELPKCLETRCNFNPTQYKTHIYLLGGHNCSVSEYFDVNSAAFHRLPFEIEADCTIAICSDSHLIAIQRNGYYQWPLNHWENREKRSFPFNLGIGFWSDCPVIEVQGVYYLHQSYATRVVALNLPQDSYTVFPVPIH